MKHPLIATKLGSLALICCSTVFAPQARAARYDISMTADGFLPAYLEVMVGDRVYWWNEDYDYFDYHSTRSYSYPWNSGPIDVGYGVYLVAAKTGSYEYTDDWGYIGWGTLVIKPYVPPTPPPPPSLCAVARLTDGGFQCTVSNLVAGAIFYIEASTNLVDWAGIYVGVATGVTETYVDQQAAAFPRRFYRAVAVP